MIILLTDEEKSRVLGDSNQKNEIMPRIVMNEDEAGRTQGTSGGIGFKALA